MLTRPTSVAPEHVELVKYQVRIFYTTELQPSHHRCRAIVDSEIKVDYVRLAVAQPYVNLLHPGRRWPTVGRSSINIRDSHQFFFLNCDYAGAPSRIS
jgi:hypothetical protein